MGKHKFLTIKEKLKLIEDRKSGNKIRELSDKYLVSTGAVSDIIKNEDKYRLLSKSRLKLKSVPKMKYEKVNETVLKYIQSANTSRVPIDGPNIKSFAKEIAKSMNLVEFKASNGWLSKLMRRHYIKLKKITGESGGVDPKVVNDRMSEIPSHLEGYDPKDIFNYDETALFFRLLPKKSYLTEGDRKSVV